MKGWVRSFLSSKRQLPELRCVTSGFILAAPSAWAKPPLSLTLEFSRKEQAFLPVGTRATSD
jgi:hypothetical protein